MATQTFTGTGQAYAPQAVKPTAIVSDGTSLWVAGDNGKIHQYTISGGAYAGIVASVTEKIVDMAINGTHLLVCTDKGKVYSFTLSTAASEGLALNLVSEGITNIAVYSGVAYITTNKGDVYAYTLG
jgi:hypothetical protein